MQTGGNAAHRRLLPPPREAAPVGRAQACPQRQREDTQPPAGEVGRTTRLLSGENRPAHLTASAITTSNERPSLSRRKLKVYHGASTDLRGGSEKTPRGGYESGAAEPSTATRRRARGVRP